jgi:[ribosomal protein S18]-alanine N-acetyltransferase
MAWLCPRCRSEPSAEAGGKRWKPAGHAYRALISPPELQDVEVRERFRRCGIASALVAAVEPAARAAGALYARLGFSDTGEPARRVVGTVQIRTGSLEVDDLLLTWAKGLD